MSMRTARRPRSPQGIGGRAPPSSPPSGQATPMTSSVRRGLHENRALAVPEARVRERNVAVGVLGPRHVRHELKGCDACRARLIRPGYCDPVVENAHAVRPVEASLQAPAIGEADENGHGAGRPRLRFHGHVCALGVEGRGGVRLALQTLRFRLRLGARDRLRLRGLPRRLRGEGLLARAVQGQALLVLPVLLLAQEVALCGHGRAARVPRIVGGRAARSKAAKIGRLEVRAETRHLSGVRGELRVHGGARGGCGQVIGRGRSWSLRPLPGPNGRGGLRRASSEIVHLDAVFGVQTRARDELLELPHAHVRDSGVSQLAVTLQRRFHCSSQGRVVNLIHFVRVARGARDRALRIAVGQSECPGEQTLLL
mmetsp:Transcript_25469/g.74798  ORF Transcript_25469/g.74798 Transcript_25469/m.74798 type:complete len:369 (-) Transcript_25469:656-1762(-)